MRREVVRVGLAGAGWVSQHHLQAYHSLRDRAVVAAIADPRREAALDRAARYGIPSHYDSVEEMLERERLDVLDIAAPREAHVPLCRLALRHGLAVLCQKPLAPTLGEAEQLLAELVPGTRLMVHENWRFRPHYRQIRAWIAEGRIGPIRSVFLTVLTSGLLPDEQGRLPALERQPMMAGLQRLLLMEVLIHHLDTLRFLLGPLSLEAARLGRSCSQVRGEDRAALFLTAGEGAAVSLLGDFMAWGYPPGIVDRLELLGTRGSIFLDENRLRLVGEGEEVQPVDLAADYQASYRGAISHFLDRLADGGPFETSVEEHLETLRIAEAAYERA